MTSTYHDDRFDHEGDTHVDLWTRERIAERLRLLDEAKTRFDAAREALKLEASIFANAVLQIDPNWIETWERSTRRRSASPQEAAQGFVDLVADTVSGIDDHVAEFLDHEDIEGARRLADTGRSDD